MNVFRWGLWHIADFNQAVLSSSRCEYELATFSRQNTIILGRNGRFFVGCFCNKQINDTKTLCDLGTGTKFRKRSVARA